LVSALSNLHVKNFPHFVGRVSGCGLLRQKNEKFREVVVVSTSFMKK
jgi:hypothetical protein